MNIAAMNIRIIFQKNTVVSDAIGNHTNEWVDYFSCYATASGQSGDESEEAGQISVSEKLDFTVRYCSETSVIVPDKYRVRLGERIYNIKSVSDMAFKKKSLKMHAQLERS